MPLVILIVSLPSPAIMEVTVLLPEILIESALLSLPPRIWVTVADPLTAMVSVPVPPLMETTLPPVIEIVSVPAPPSMEETMPAETIESSPASP